MRRNRTAFFILVAVVVGILSLYGTAFSEPLNMAGDSLVLAGTTPGYLCFDSLVKGSVSVRSNFRADKKDTVVYTEGRDYIVDYKKGTIARTKDSAIPDYTQNSSFNLPSWNHGSLSGFSNHPYFVWVDYTTSNPKTIAMPNDQSKYTGRMRGKLEAGGAFKVVSYGDSIAAGGEASDPDLRFQARFGKYLQEKYPNAQVEVVDASISGYTSQQGVDWFDRYLEPVQNIDVVLLGFGMNDHNVPGVGVPVEKFKSNFITIVKMIRERKGADVIIFSSMPPNATWQHGSHRMGQYAQAAKEAAKETGCAYVDVYSVWQSVLKRKDQSSLLGNNINHPNDFGHWLYEQAFEAVKL